MNKKPRKKLQNKQYVKNETSKNSTKPPMPHLPLKPINLLTSVHPFGVSCLPDGSLGGQPNTFLLIIIIFGVNKQRFEK